MSQFIGYTIGLDCWVRDKLRSVKVEYQETEEGDVKLSAVNGCNLAGIPRVPGVTMPRAAFDARPADPYDSTAEAIWALDMLGLAPARATPPNTTGPQGPCSFSKTLGS